MYSSPSTFVLVQLGPDGKPVKKVPKADLDPQRRARQDRSNARAKKYYAKQQAVRAAAQKSERKKASSANSDADASVFRHSTTTGAESSRDGATWSAERQDQRDQSATTLTTTTTSPPSPPASLSSRSSKRRTGSNTPDDPNSIVHRLPVDPYRPPRLRKYNTRGPQPEVAERSS